MCHIAWLHEQQNLHVVCFYGCHQKQYIFTAGQAGKSRVRFPIVVFDIFH
jgi:hypothetical protein